MQIRALIFDFDGLILDTETPDVEAWKAIYAEHGRAYPVEHWSQIIGGWGNSDFDPAAGLQQLTDAPLDLDALRRRQREESDKVILRSPVMEGAREILAGAKRLGLRCAIASSSERAWVEPHLIRLGLRANFEVVVTGDDVQNGRTKPHPDVYLKALASLQLRPDEVLVFEDSPNGVKAAHAAGMRVVGVPNPVTAVLRLDADVALRSLDEVPLDDILKRIDDLPRGPGMPRALQDAAA
jgi:HAD superfamily hydrolase (TIGR01509 family)